MYIHGHGFSKVQVEGVQRLCSWVRGTGTPRFSCAVVPVSCRGGQLFVGGWSGQGGGGMWILHIQSQKIFQLKLATPPLTPPK